MNAKTTVIAIFSFVLGILLMRLLDELQPEPTHDDSVYKKAIEQKDEKIKKDSILIVKLKNEKDTIIKEIYRDRTFYKTIYEKITHSNSVDRINAFDTLLTK